MINLTEEQINNLFKKCIYCEFCEQQKKIHYCKFHKKIINENVLTYYCSEYKFYNHIKQV